MADGRKSGICIIQGDGCMGDVANFTSEVLQEDQNVKRKEQERILKTRWS